VPQQPLSSFLPWDDLPTVLARAAESLEASVKQAGFRASGLNPKLMTARGTLQVIAAFHLDKARPKVLDLGAVKELVEGGDPSGSPDEKLYSTRIACYVRLFLLCDPHFARVGAYRARKHLLTI
jgi:hypothetical protein